MVKLGHVLGMLVVLTQVLLAFYNTFSKYYCTFLYSYPNFFHMIYSDDHID